MTIDSDSDFSLAEPERPNSYFDNFHLKRLVRENHGSSMTACVFAKYPGVENLLITTGGNQVLGID